MRSSSTPWTTKGAPTIPSTVVTGYRYKLDEPTFNSADSSVHEARYNTGKDFGTRRWDVAFTGVPGTMLSVDSAYQLPASRRERKTFFEAYNQRLWLRQEGDTVHMNSWLIFPGGGFDRDSPYAVKSNMTIHGDSLRQYPVRWPWRIPWTRASASHPPYRRML